MKIIALMVVVKVKAKMEVVLVLVAGWLKKVEVQVAERSSGFWPLP